MDSNCKDDQDKTRATDQLNWIAKKLVINIDRFKVQLIRHEVKKEKNCKMKFKMNGVLFDISLLEQVLKRRL